jgi:hypothetical protein
MNKLVHFGMTILACLPTLSQVSARAAEIRMSPTTTDESIATVEGKIESGDFEKFKAFLNTNRPTRLYLASPGGSLNEALRIGLMVRTLNLSTIVPGKPLTRQARELALMQHHVTNAKDYQCTSACFFVFVAGVHRSSDEFGPPLLGIHRPFLPGKDVNALIKNSAVDADGDLKQSIGKYLRVMDVPEKYLDNMFSTPSDKVLLIRNDEFEADFDGFVPRLKQWAEDRCHAELAKTQRGCELNIETELAHVHMAN